MLVNTKKIEIKHFYNWRTKDGKKWERYVVYTFDRVKIDKIHEAILFEHFPREKWIYNVRIKKKDGYIQWIYKNRNIIYITEKDVRVSLHTYVDRSVYNTAFRAIKILDSIGLVENLRIERWSDKYEVMV